MRTRHKTAKKSNLKQSLAKTLPAKPQAQKNKRKSKANAKPAAPTTVLAPPINHEIRDALPRPAKLQELDRQLKVTQTSTASLGKYDKRLEGEKTRIKGVRRQYDSNEIDTQTEQERYKAAFASLGNDEKIERRKAGVEEGKDLVNVRKAIRNASGGQGSASLVRRGEEKSSSRGGGGRGKTRSSLGRKGRGK